MATGSKTSILKDENNAGYVVSLYFYDVRKDTSIVQKIMFTNQCPSKKGRWISHSK